MVGGVFQNLKLPSRLTKRDFLLTILPGLAWMVVLQGRPWIQTGCVIHPGSCSPDSIFILDRASWQIENALADAISFNGQALSGILALAAALLWDLGWLR